ncbi:MAG TPA: methylated-DNA--[protein]-cysteine S-methyltransferase [Acidimicrobiales bacterium]|jgi:methylated-DNA-[protein]-cysteine S-methyltransferase|nr:methylated-DNA--[protein]-cysteine S-methyltransferase [Acidimicrobiales bacterium]
MMHDQRTRRLRRSDQSTECLRSLHDRLLEQADAEHLVDIAYRTVDTPLGSLLIAATDVGLVRVAFEREDHTAVLAGLKLTLSPRILRAVRRTEVAAQQLDEYFAGHRRVFDLPIDLRLVHGFRHDVIARLPDIPYGTTASYAEFAEKVGNPKAVRAVGTACAHNPLPVIVPCHRVVRSDGSIGEYLGGTSTKRALLDLEAG